jgi:outer membrane protein assembly factor BamD (BamD/ComL family)
MKRFFLVSVVLLFSVSFNANAFWIWSPKTGEWKNPKYSPAASPQVQLKEALADFDAKNYKQALAEFRKLVNYFPDSEQAAQAQYYIAKSYQKINNPYRAFREYQELIETYPNSKKIQQAIKAQYEIGQFFTSWKPKRILGIPANLWDEHPCVRIFNAIVDNSSYSEYAPRALHQLGIFLYKNKRYFEAQEAFNKLIDTYPKNELVDSAKYHLALAIKEENKDYGYDQDRVTQARKQLDELVSKPLPQDMAQKTAQELDILKNKEAKHKYNIALFYEKQGKIDSALIYYRLVKDNYPNTDFADKAQAKIRKITRGK